MRGCIVKPKGRRKSWGVKVYLGRDPGTGKPRQKWFSFPTRKEAEAHLSQVLARIHGGGMIPTTKITVGKFLEDWLQKYATINVRETSFKSYRDIVRQHLIPALGTIPLVNLSALDVQDYYTRKRQGDPRRSSTPCRKPRCASTTRSSTRLYSRPCSGACSPGTSATA